MESELNDSYVDLESYDVSKVIRLQALFRGILVRRQMKTLQDIYLGIVHSIETNRNLTVSWDGELPSYPKFNKHKKQKKVETSNENEAEIIQGKCRDNVEYPKATELEGLDREMISVEIQTNNINSESNYACSAKEAPLLYTNHNHERQHLDSENKGNFCQSDFKPDSRVEEPVRILPVDSDTLDKTANHVDIADPVQGQQDEDQSDASSLTDVTSVWESDSKLKSDEVRNINSSSILEVRKNIAMELLWVQQAINSRKNYLRLKSQME